MATDLVMKVKADVKDASKALKELGYDVELVETKTKKAKQEQDLWHKAIEKGAKDNIKHLVDMGAKIVSFTALTAAAYKGIKSCVDEALKQNEEAKKKIEDVQTVWNEIKADLGTKLLDTVTPALDKLYTKLKEIRDWADEDTRRKGISAALHSGMGGMELYSIFGKDAIENFQEEIYGNRAYNADEQKAFMDAYIESRKATNPKFAEMVNAIETNKANGSPISNIEAARNALNAVRRPGRDMSEAEANWIAQYQSTGVAYKPQARPGSVGYSDPLGALYASEAYFDQLKAEEEKEKEHLEEMRALRKEYYSDIRTMGMQTFSALTGAYSQSIQNQMQAVEQSTMSEEEKNRKMNDLAEKQFNAERLNSAASVTMSTAESIMNIWSKYGSKPVYASALTALATATGGAQLATIASQQYSPFAAGGIVSSPTHALIGEGGEKEAVLPLSKLKEFVEPQQSGVINLTINVSDGGGRDGVADAVFYAIERAQRTGALPRWRYAS